MAKPVQRVFWWIGLSFALGMALWLLVLTLLPSDVSKPRWAPPEHSFHSPVFSADGDTVYYLESKSLIRHKGSCELARQEIWLRRRGLAGQSAETLLSWPSSPGVGYTLPDCAASLGAATLHRTPTGIAYAFEAGKLHVRGNWQVGVKAAGWTPGRHGLEPPKADERIHGRREVILMNAKRASGLVLYDDEEPRATQLVANGMAYQPTLQPNRSWLEYARSKSLLLARDLRARYVSAEQVALVASPITEQRARKLIAAGIVPRESATSSPAVAFSRALESPGQPVKGYLNDGGNYLLIRWGSRYFELAHWSTQALELVYE